MGNEIPLAAIDLGSNSIRLLCVRHKLHACPILKVFCRELRIARVGEGFELDRLLKQPAMERAICVLAELLILIREYDCDCPRIVTTGVVRDAINQGAFLDLVEGRTGIRPQVLKGEEEAALSLLGVCSTLQGLSLPLLICDVGGGSTELAVLTSDGNAHFSSIPIGAVKLVEMLDIAAPMKRDHEQAMMMYIRTNLARTFPACETIAMLAAPAGTPTTLASIDQALTVYDPLKVHGYRFHGSRIREIYEILKGLSLEERREIPGLQPGREDIIVPGIAILLCVMERFGVASLTVSEGGLLEGVLAQAYEERFGVFPRIEL